MRGVYKKFQISSSHGKLSGKVLLEHSCPSLNVRTLSGRSFWLIILFEMAERKDTFGCGREQKLKELEIEAREAMRKAKTTAWVVIWMGSWKELLVTEFY